MARSYTALTIAFIGSFLFAVFLCYTDKDCKSISDLFNWGTVVISFIYAFPVFGVLAILSQLRINENLACSILLFLSFLFSAWATNKGHNYWLGVAIYTLIYFFPLAIIYIISNRIGNKVGKIVEHKRENEDIARQQFI